MKGHALGEWSLNRKALGKWTRCAMIERFMSLISLKTRH